MSPTPNFDDSARIPLASGVFYDPNRADYDCVDQKIYVTDDGNDAVPGDSFIARFDMCGKNFEEVINVDRKCIYSSNCFILAVMHSMYINLILTDLVIEAIYKALMAIFRMHFEQCGT